MPRKGTAEPDDLLKDLPGTEEGDEKGEGEGNGSAAEVAVRGKGRTVADALKRAGLKGQAKDLKGKFNDLLKNPTNKITASRIFPRTLRGPEGKSYDCSEVVDLPPPLTYTASTPRGERKRPIASATVTAVSSAAVASRSSSVSPSWSPISRRRAA